MDHTATYSPEDNKLRIYPACRLDSETYERVKAAGFHWAPKQELFVAPAWSPSREDFARELCGDIGDEDTSLVERAEAKAERLEDLSDRRAADGDRAQAGVHRIADGIPFGQPILVGHHSEKRARKDAEKIQNGMRKAVDMWKASEYWKDRARGAVRLAKYKERPDVRARRIKGLEAEIRQLKSRYTPLAPQVIMQQRWNSERDAPKIPHIYCGPKGSRGGSWVAVEDIPKLESGYARWIAHLENRIVYERAMLDDSGGLVAEQQEIKVGGRVLVRGEWVTVLRVNRKDGKVCSFRTARRYVPIVGAEEVRGYEPPSEDQGAKVADAMKKGTLCNYPGEGFATMTQAEWDAVNKDYRGSREIAATETTDRHRARICIGFRCHLPAPTGKELEPGYCSANRTHHYWPVFVTDAKRKDPPAKPLIAQPEPEPELFAPRPDLDALEERTRRQVASREASDTRGKIEAMQQSLTAGVQVVAAPQLFPTPADLAARMVEEAGIEDGHRVLEPSIGTGNIARAVFDRAPVFIVGVEINPLVLGQFNNSRTCWGNTRIETYCGDFLEQNGNLGTFDRILMNPPFQNGADIKHITHALHMLKPGGRLVAICANGSRQQATLKPLAENSGGWWEELPAGTFAEQGTNVNTALLVIEK